MLKKTLTRVQMLLYCKITFEYIVKEKILRHFSVIKIDKLKFELKSQYIMKMQFKQFKEE